MSTQKTHIVVTQTAGLSHKSEAQRLIIKGLGLRRIGHSVAVRDTAPIRGMIVKVQHLVTVEVKVGEAPLFGLRHKNADGTLKAAGKPATKSAKAAK